MRDDRGQKRRTAYAENQAKCKEAVRGIVVEPRYHPLTKEIKRNGEQGQHDQRKRDDDSVGNAGSYVIAASPSSVFTSANRSGSGRTR